MSRKINAPWGGGPRVVAVYNASVSRQKDRSRFVISEDFALAAAAPNERAYLQRAPIEF